MEKRGGAEALCVRSTPSRESGGLLPRKNFVIFSALSFNLVQTEGKYAVGKKYQKCKGGENDTRGGRMPPAPP